MIKDKGFWIKEKYMIKHNFRQLIIWKESITLAKEVYVLTQELPKEHKFGLSSQIFRSAISISSNIAEGTSRSSQKEFVYFLRISLGSAFELETQLLIAQQCNIITVTDSSSLIEKIQTIQKQIVSFINTIKAAE